MVHQQVFKLDELYFPHLTWHDLPSSQICVSVSPQTISDKPIHHAYLHNSTQSHSITHHLSFLDLINKNPQRPSPPTTWQPWPWADLPTWPDCLWVYGSVCVCINLIVFCMSGHTHNFSQTVGCVCVCENVVWEGARELLGALHLLRKYLSLWYAIFHCLSIFLLSETFTSTSIPTFSEVLQSQKWGPSIHPGKTGKKLHLTSLITCTHTHMHTLAPLITTFSSFNVCKPSFISVPCIMAQRWYHQRQASLTKWEQQIDCSIRREGPLSGNLIGSH